MRKIYSIVILLGLMMMFWVNAGQSATPSGREGINNMNKVRLRWKAIPGAVQYQLVLLKDETDTKENIIYTENGIFTNGIELDLRQYSGEKAGFYWKVCPLDYFGRAVSRFSTPRPITDGEINARSMAVTSELERMAYTPVYPVFSWIPYLGADHYQVRVYRKGATKREDKLLREIWADSYSIYEDGGYTYPGDYYWQVRAMRPDNRAISDWSAPSYFKVTSPTPVAALGDSITHGGGVVSMPPGQMLYDWETYSEIPIKNISYSGNTTAEMLERFDRDVLPFKPQILVIIGGVNDYRSEIGVETITGNLAAIRNKCQVNGIIPVFGTITSINPQVMLDHPYITPPCENWQDKLNAVNEWISTQRYYVDVSTVLADEKGCLRREYTTDGLHPDYFGKRYIGERISTYLKITFPNIVDDLTWDKP